MEIAAEKCALQTLHVDHLSRHLQQHPVPQQPLPIIRARSIQNPQEEAADLSAQHIVSDDNALPSTEVLDTSADSRKKRQQAPCRYVLT